MGRSEASRIKPSEAWHGQWIAYVDPLPGEESFLGGVAPAPAFEKHFFRRRFELPVVPAYAPVRLTADSRYVLYCNGTEIGRGPVRSSLRTLHYDEYDVAPHLRRGSNTLLVLVTFYAEPTSFWAPPPASGIFGRVPVLVADGWAGDVCLATDERWDCARSTAWTSAPREGIEGLPVEVLDARLLDAGWRSGEGGDWRPARIHGVSHFGGLARSSPPTHPFGTPRPRGIAFADGGEVPPRRARLGPLRGPARDVGGLTPREIFATQWTHVAPAPSDEAPTDSIIVDLGAGPGRRGGVLDFGRVVAGVIELDITAPPGTRIHMRFLERDAVPSGENDGYAAASYTARGSDDDYRSQEVVGLRYALFIVDSPLGGEVRIHRPRVRERLIAASGPAFFASSDPELDAIYRAGVRTVELCSMDAYVDCPTREQRTWVGDGVIHQSVTLTTSDDWRLARRHVQLCASPRSDGILPMAVAGDIEHSAPATIPDWSLHWIHSVHTLHLYSADLETTRSAAPVARRILEWFAAFARDGVLVDVPEWPLVDWSSIFLSGRSSLLTALWARALREYSELSAWLGNVGERDWAIRHLDAVRQGFEVFWDDDRGTFVDHLPTAGHAPAASQLAGAAAIVAGLAAEDRMRRVIDWISDEARQVDRTWIGSSEGYDAERMIRYLRGTLEADWDTQQQVVIAQPFGAAIVHAAFVVAGRTDLLTRSVRRWSRFLREGYDTFGECWSWGTPAHGWSATATSDIVRAIAGVTPSEPGYATARIAPAYGELDRFHAVVPTPRGPLEVEWNDPVVSVQSPVPFVLRDRSGREHLFPAGNRRIEA